VRILRPDVATFQSLFGPMTRTIWICSPWISSQGSALLKTAIERCEMSKIEEIELWMRLEPDDQRFGMTDFGAVASLITWIEAQMPAVNLFLRTSPTLHAKVFWTDCGALIGSANLTSAGLSSNIELDVLLDAVEAADQCTVRKTHRPSLRPFDKSELEELSRISVADTSVLGGREDAPTPGQVSDDTAAGESWDNFVQELLSDRHPTGGGIR
jgi:phosphatidylserine/phosphatidylglycerophosphate/cardiolipin synthase-like enzyme